MNTLSIIQKMLIEEYGLSAQEVDADALLEELGIDSLATIEFMFLLEDKFKILMSGEAVPVRSVGDIAREVDLQIARQAENALVPRCE